MTQSRFPKLTDWRCLVAVQSVGVRSFCSSVCRSSGRRSSVRNSTAYTPHWTYAVLVERAQLHFPRIVKNYVDFKFLHVKGTLWWMFFDDCLRLPDIQHQPLSMRTIKSYSFIVIKYPYRLAVNSMQYNTNMFNHRRNTFTIRYHIYRIHNAFIM